MPSTERADSLILERRRAFVLAFWMVLSVVVCALVTLASAVADAASPSEWGIAAMLAIALPGAVWRPWFDGAVWVWNGSVRRIAAGLRVSALRVGYYLLVVPWAVAGLSLRGTTGRPEWRVRQADDFVRELDQGWTADRSAWQVVRLFARTSEQPLALGLVPLVILLTLLRDEQQASAIPASTYTLY